ncbi:cytochrome P450 [Gordonia iterans]
MPATPGPARRGSVLPYELAGGPGRIVVISDPAHVKSVMTADPAIAPSATRRSPLRPIVGAESVLTSIGARHWQQRALLLPRFHGKSVQAFADGIAGATDTALNRWRPGEPVRTADVAQQITLDVIMSVVFGIPEPGAASEAERALRVAVIRFLRLSTTPLADLTQLLNSRSAEPNLVLRAVLRPMNDAIARLLAERRAEGAVVSSDILGLLLAARTDAGERLPDSEIRDELVTLVLAGHETTSNSVAWTVERLTRNPAVYRDARDSVRAGETDYLDALLNESMRSRPVVPGVARELLCPWRFGDVEVEAGTTAAVSALLLHHRDDLYPRPFAFDPERFLESRPAPHTLLPFGGGIRRCLGAPLAMAEMQIVVREILRRVDLRTTHRPAERPKHRNVTMIPENGGIAVADAVRS